MAPPKRSTSLILIYLFVGLAGIATALEAQLELPGDARVKRHASSDSHQQSLADRGRPGQVTVSAQGSAQASVTSLSPTSTGDGHLDTPIGHVGTNHRSKRPKAPVASPPDTDVDGETTLEDDELPVRRRPKKRRPINRRPAVVREDDDVDGAEDDYEECHNDDYDYGRAFHEAATRPMRHFGRMMEGMFSRMEGLTAREFDRIPGGGNAAVASSSSSGDGYSRMESVVSNNGRTRGIVTETRNGRTKTRRLDSNDDDEEE